MNAQATFLPLAIALITALLFPGSWTVLAMQPEISAVTTGSPETQASPSHYQSFTNRLQKQWRVDPLVADAHNLSSTGWGTTACAPRGAGLTQAATSGGYDTEQCVQKCMKGSTLTNPNGLLLCRSSCL